MEHDDLVDPVEELRPEVGAKRLHHLTPRAFIDAGGRGGRSPLLRVELAADQRPFGDELTAKVRRHDHDGVLEIDRPALAVGEPAVIEQLEENVEHFRMGLFDFIEKHHGVRATADGFGELTGFLVADVSGRRTDHP